MAWFDELFLPPSVTVPIPQFRPPGAFKYGLRDPATGGLHQSVFGTPFIPTPFDESPNVLRPGMAPGQADVAPKPPLPTRGAPLMGRNPAPATSLPEPSIYQENAPPDLMPGAYYGMRVDNPAFKQPSVPEPPKQPSWYDRNKEWITMASRDLGALGRGMLQAPPGYNAFGQGFANVVDDREKRIDTDLKRQLLKAQVGEVEQKGEIRKQAQLLAKSLPEGHPSRPYFALGLVEKGLEHLTPDYNKLIIVGPDGKPQLNATLMNAKAFIEAAGKWQWGVTGHDVGGKPVHGWVNPMMQGAMPGAPSMPGTPPAAVPTASPPSSAAPSSPPPAASAPGREGVPPPPPGVDPYKWAEEQAKLRIQKQSMETARKQQAPIVIQDIDRAIDRIKNQSDLWPQTGFGGMLTNQIGGNQLAKIMSGVQANIGFDALNQMRANSPTGAALGQVTERELSFLQSVYGSLSVSTTQTELMFNLRRLKNAMLDVIHGPGQGPTREKLDGAAAATPKTGTTRSGLKYRVE